MENMILKFVIRIILRQIYKKEIGLYLLVCFIGLITFIKSHNF